MAESVYISGESYPVVRRKLREWLSIEAIKDDLVEAAQTHDAGRLASCVISYVCAAYHIDRSAVEQANWVEIAKAFIEDQLANIPNSDFPIVRSKNKEKHKEAWDYKGREWFTWAHIFASTYGWSLEYIANLDINDAVGLLQEIQLREQLNREWDWATSEIAYQFNESTKKSEFKPLDRPDWMAPTIDIQMPAKVRIPIAIMPKGLVMKWDDGERHTDD